jgi:hypothetical protein
MADSQVPWYVDAPAGSITDAAWRSKPSWYLVTQQRPHDPARGAAHMARRIGATVTEVAASHSVYVPRPPPSPT